jgi:hypothetical protein
MSSCRPGTPNGCGRRELSRSQHQSSDHSIISFAMPRNKSVPPRRRERQRQWLQQRLRGQAGGRQQAAWPRASGPPAPAAAATEALVEGAHQHNAAELVALRKSAWTRATCSTRWQGMAGNGGRSLGSRQLVSKQAACCSTVPVRPVWSSGGLTPSPAAAGGGRPSGQHGACQAPGPAPRAGSGRWGPEELFKLRGRLAG